MFTIKADTLRDEMDQINALVGAIKERIDAGVPGEDLPANDVAKDVFLVQLRGELMLASQRLMALAEVLE